MAERESGHGIAADVAGLAVLRAAGEGKAGVVFLIGVAVEVKLAENAPDIVGLRNTAVASSGRNQVQGAPSSGFHSVRAG